MENQCSPSEASRAAEVLFGCYRTGGAAEPEIFVAGVAAVLSDYPLAVIERVVDPRIGLPCRTNWLPTIAEVKTACEAEMAPIRRQREAEARAEQTRLQIADRTGSKEDRPTLEQLREITGMNDLGTRYPRRPEPLRSEEELLAIASLPIGISPELAAKNREYLEKLRGGEPA